MLTPEIEQNLIIKAITADKKSKAGEILNRLFAAQHEEFSKRSIFASTYGFLKSLTTSTGENMAQTILREQKLFDEYVSVERSNKKKIMRIVNTIRMNKSFIDSEKEIPAGVIEKIKSVGVLLPATFFGELSGSFILSLIRNGNDKDRRKSNIHRQVRKRHREFFEQLGVNTEITRKKEKICDDILDDEEYVEPADELGDIIDIVRGIGLDIGEMKKYLEDPFKQIKYAVRMRCLQTELFQKMDLQEREMLSRYCERLYRSWAPVPPMFTCIMGGLVIYRRKFAADERYYQWLDYLKNFIDSISSQSMADKENKGKENSLTNCSLAFALMKAIYRKLNSRHINYMQQTAVANMVKCISTQKREIIHEVIKLEEVLYEKANGSRWSPDLINLHESLLHITPEMAKILMGIEGDTAEYNIDDVKAASFRLILRKYRKIFGLLLNANEKQYRKVWGNSIKIIVNLCPERWGQSLLWSLNTKLGLPKHHSDKWYKERGINVGKINAALLLGLMVVLNDKAMCGKQIFSVVDSAYEENLMIIDWIRFQLNNLPCLIEATDEEIQLFSTLMAVFSAKYVEFEKMSESIEPQELLMFRFVEAAYKMWR